MAARKKSAKKASKTAAPAAKSAKARGGTRKAAKSTSARVSRAPVVSKMTAKKTKAASGGSNKATTAAQATKSKVSAKVRANVKVEAKTKVESKTKAESKAKVSSAAKARASKTQGKAVVAAKKPAAVRLAAVEAKVVVKEKMVLAPAPSVEPKVAEVKKALDAPKIAAPEAPKTIKTPEPAAKAPIVPTPPVQASAPKLAEKVLETKTAVKVTTPATVATPTVAAKTQKAPQPAKTTADEQGGEQRTMKNSATRLGFKLNEFVVYPAHGVGQIVALEEQEVAGFRLELFVINFTKDKMTLRVPTAKVVAVGMRKLSDADQARRSLEILTGRARIKRTMWSRRAQEYEAKINSGDINSIAEVVRDLFRSEAQPEQSYSERQLYEAALDRMMREIAAVQKLSDTEALKLIEGQLKKNAKRAVKADAVEGETEDGDIEEAA